MTTLPYSFAGYAPRGEMREWIGGNIRTPGPYVIVDGPEGRELYCITLVEERDVIAFKMRWL
ncbi:hypothetical protein ACFODL_15420 [Phenylobacterium terrae]|uniref:Uncharacterized protein n=1 Tax=Phenylobacterium terrae TaxID=2665495 RepID=A0ABW4N8X9_9CAUL